MSKEEIEAKQQSRREMHQRQSDAWAAVKAGNANDTQMKFLKNNFFYKGMLGWKKFKEDPSTVPLDLQVVIVKGIVWKKHKAKILGMGEEGAELAGQIASIEASANAEMERRKAEKERIEAERKKKRLENINKELESIKKVKVEKRTTMQTIRFNFLNASLNGTRREQVYWREKHTAEKKKLKAEKAAERRVEIESKIKSLSTIKRTEEEEFQFNILNAQLRGEKKKVKRLKSEKKAAEQKRKEEKAATKEQEINDWYEQSYKPKQQQQLQQQQLIQQQQQQQQQQLVQQQNLLHYEENQLNQQIQQREWLIQRRQQQQWNQEEQTVAHQWVSLQQQQLQLLQDRLLQIQQQKQQNLVAYMQLQSKSQQQQYLLQLQSQQPTTQTSSQTTKPKKQRKLFNYNKVMKLLPEQLNQTTAREFVEKADEMFEGATPDEKCGRWRTFKRKLNPQQLSHIEEARTHLKRKRRM